MKVAILMGSDKDMPKMQAGADVLAEFGVDHEVHVMSAHRTPERVAAFATGARAAGYGAIICGAGKAAHLAGAVAAHSTLPVIGVPIAAGGMGGLDDVRRGTETEGAGIADVEIEHVAAGPSRFIGDEQDIADGVLDIACAIGGTDGFLGSGLAHGSILRGER